MTRHGPYFPGSLTNEHTRLKAARQAIGIAADTMGKLTGLDVQAIESGRIEITREIRHAYQVAISQRRRESRI